MLLECISFYTFLGNTLELEYIGQVLPNETLILFNGENTTSIFPCKWSTISQWSFWY